MKEGAAEDEAYLGNPGLWGCWVVRACVCLCVCVMACVHICECVSTCV